MKNQHETKVEEKDGSSSQSIGEDSSKLSIEEIVLKVGGATSAKVLETLSESTTYPEMIGRKLNRSRNAIQYHINKLQKYGLIRRVGYEGEGNVGEKVYFSATPKGEKVLEELEVPDAETFKKSYYGGKNLL